MEDPALDYPGYKSTALRAPRNERGRYRDEPFDAPRSACPRARRRQRTAGLTAEEGEGDGAHAQGTAHDRRFC